MDAEHNTPTRRLRAYYREHPRMVSSPFGGVDSANIDLLAEVSGALGLPIAGRRLLDVGCGRGFAGEWFAAQGASCIGADFVVSRGGFRLVGADAQALPFPPEAFDGLCCIDAFEHIPDPQRAAAEFRRVLRPGGWVFLSAPNYGNTAGLVKAWCERFGRYEKNTWAPFGNWTPQELEHALTARRVRHIFAAAGFRETARLGYGPEVGLGLIPWMTHPRTPEGVLFRLQRLFARIGPAIARRCPGASLHNFWRFDA